MRLIFLLFIWLIPQLSLAMIQTCQSYWFFEKVALRSDTLDSRLLFHSDYSAGFRNDSWFRNLYVIVGEREKFKVVRNRAYLYSSESDSWEKMIYTYEDDTYPSAKSFHEKELRIDARDLKRFGVSAIDDARVKMALSKCAPDRPAKPEMPPPVQFKLKVRMKDRDHVVNGNVSFLPHPAYESLPNGSCPDSCR